MRTIKQAIAELKEKDSNTAFTESALRRAVSSGDIPHIKAGNKVLVNLDTVESYLNGTLSNDKLTDFGNIRRLA